MLQSRSKLAGQLCRRNSLIGSTIPPSELLCRSSLAVAGTRRDRRHPLTDHPWTGTRQDRLHLLTGPLTLGYQQGNCKKFHCVPGFCFPLNLSVGERANLATLLFSRTFSRTRSSMSRMLWAGDLPDATFVLLLRAPDCSTTKGPTTHRCNLQYCTRLVPNHRLIGNINWLVDASILINGWGIIVRVRGCLPARRSLS